MIKLLQKFFTKTIKRQIIIAIVTTHALMMSIFIYDLTSNQKEFLHNQSLSQVISLTNALAKNSTSWVLANDIIGMEEIIESISEYPTLKYAMILDKNGKVLAHSEKVYHNKYVSDKISTNIIKADPESLVLINNLYNIDVAIPILHLDNHIGWARVAITQEDNIESVNLITNTGIIYTLVAISVAWLFGFLLSSNLTKDLYNLIDIAKQKATGKKTLRTNTKRHDEIGILSNEVDNMLDHIEKNEIDLTNSNQKLIEFNQNLELMIEEKTIDLEKKNRELEENEHELNTLNENLANRVKEEVAKLNSVQKQLFKSEKMASMGEMIGNIAHQWRQPLSIISTAATGMKLQKEFNTLEDDDFNKSCDLINDNAQYLSRTIDDFRNFIKGDREKIDFNLKDTMNSFTKLISSSIKNHEINMDINISEDINMNGYPNELIQCFMNLFNNSKDAFLDRKINVKYIFIESTLNKDTIYINFKDNAGGIPDEILTKIFDPYFTTKHSSKGTGLGLHMTYNIIVEGMNGAIEVNTIEYEYNNTKQVGTEFIISLPIVLNNKFKTLDIS